MDGWLRRQTDRSAAQVVGFGDRAGGRKRGRQEAASRSALHYLSVSHKTRMP